jgi:hypothetical protein
MISVDASKYGMPNDQNWMETKVEVDASKMLEITAQGKVDLWPQQPNQYMVGPNGEPQQGMGTPIMQNNGVYQFTSGTLIGKIGPNGTPFAIGNSYRKTATANGFLYLKIASSSWGNNSSGKYEVVIKSSNP